MAPSAAALLGAGMAVRRPHGDGNRLGPGLCLHLGLHLHVSPGDGLPAIGMAYPVSSGGVSCGTSSSSTRRSLCTAVLSCSLEKPPKPSMSPESFRRSEHMGDSGRNAIPALL